MFVARGCEVLFNQNRIITIDDFDCVQDSYMPGLVEILGLMEPRV
jgi:hypothetical protein